jgi:ATP/maltotriose-dependent transcriptional regulator MalT
VGLLAMAWTSPITGDYDGARREASASLAQLRGQDEPFWAAQASADLGAVEMAVGRYDDALRHLREMHDLAERSGYPWLAAWSQVLTGTVAVAQGRLDQARDLLDEALDQGLAANITSSVTLGLIAFARLARADGDPGRAALLAAAAEGLRRRPGLQVWPVLRRGKPSWWPRSARRWARTGSANCPPRVPGSPSRRRWPLPGTGARPAPR